MFIRDTDEIMSKAEEVLNIVRENGKNLTNEDILGLNGFFFALMWVCKADITHNSRYDLLSKYDVK